MTEPDWVRHAIWWHVYPLGAVGAYPGEPPGPDEHRLRRLIAWLDHVVALGTSGILLGPVFASTTHGYDTVDHLRIDPRLGDDDDFDALVAEAHGRGLKVLLDGVVNHVGRDSAIARRSVDALEGRSDDEVWLLRDDDGGFVGFEGHDALVTLDHSHPSVVDYVVRVLTHWLDRGADGWRLDAAYAVPTSFWAQVLPRVRAEHPDAWFVAEVIHGDYPAFVQESTVDSVTQYELWKAIWSSINDANLWELAWSLTRHDEFLGSFVPQTFVGNHDTTRIASTIEDPRHRAHAVVVLCTVGGTPTVYAGDELGFTGVKEEREGGDDTVRPELALDGPGDDDNPVLRLHQELIGLRRRHPWLHRARTTQVELTNTTFVYEVREDDESLTVALNLGDAPLAMPAGTPVACDDTTRSDQTVVAPHGWAVLESR
ncbi:alpha-amylase family glycosyl hydrolase [Cellulomonas sp. Leaf395]|uniref:alpha-amylase family glycosyl hydrolase n=1 Tax=Cellulomonas sp. Leaf395 TaxID=1736362 RepID=UPI0007017FBF|nr:alpha-amylase family glycosyl hydrolase [Cellulomonas sp. Leaf395]KQS99368.1 alpha-amylase [Cellulomonas sp. Leaf395]